MTSTTPLPTWQDYQNADIAILKEIVRQGESRLQAQLQAALAADARAGLLSSLQAASSAALFVAAAQTEISGLAETAAYISAACLLIGASLAAWALRPIDFGFVGNRPSNWIDSIRDRERLKIGLAGTAVHLDKYLAQNDRYMAGNARLTRASLIALIAGPVLAAAYLALSQIRC